MIAGRNDFFRLLFYLISLFMLYCVLFHPDWCDFDFILFKYINLKTEYTTNNNNLPESCVNLRELTSI
jgi:hypothetical protein